MRNLGRLDIGADEIADLAWETSEGCIISITLDYLSRPHRRYMRASGEMGTLEWDGANGTVTLALAGEDKRVFPSAQNRDAMLLAQDLAFVEARRGNFDARLASGEEGIKALTVCDAARRASDKRCEEVVIY